MKALLAVLAGCAAVGLATGPAAAQIAQAPGAPVAGICIYSENALLGRSEAGVAANRQLAAFQQSASADVGAQRDKLVADVRALDAQKVQLPGATYAQRQADLQRRAQDLQTLSQVRNDQLARTRDAAISEISRAALPLLNAVIATHRCSVVFNGASVYTINPAMDLTGEVIQRLNASLPSVTLQLAAPRS